MHFLECSYPNRARSADVRWLIAISIKSRFEGAGWSMASANEGAAQDGKLNETKYE